MNTLKYPIFMAFALLTLVGCDMADNAKKSADNSGTAAGNSTKLLDLNESAYGDGRQGGSRDRRENALAMMFEEKVLDAKLQAAGAYMQAFEFQLFKSGGFREDDTSKRDRLFTDAISELVKVTKDFAPADFSNSKLADHLSTTTANAIALTAALHRVSERQREAAARYGFEAKSLLDLFLESVLSQKACDADPNVLASKPAYIYEALKEFDQVVYLLQLRLNVFAGTAIHKFSKSVKLVEGKNEIELIGGAVILRDTMDRFKLAAQVKLTLEKAGIAPAYFQDVNYGLKNFVAEVKKRVDSQQDGLAGKNTYPLFLEALGAATKL